MWKTILRRILLMIPQLLVLSILVFVLGSLMPGDALTGLIDPSISPEQIEAMREQLGLNQPVHIQYWNWLKGVLQGDFGRSFQHQQPVLSIIGQRIVPTLWLSLYSSILTYAIAITLGIISGRYEGSWADKLINLYTFVAYSIPSFVLGLLFLWLFGYKLGWFPTRGTIASGVQPGTFAAVMSRIKHMTLPAITMALLSTTGIILYLRSGIVDAKVQDYVRTARAKGVPESVIYNKHITRNSFLPVASGMGYVITGLISGAVITETIFTYQGMGLLFINSITGRDYTVMIALTLLFGTMTLLGTLLSDIIMVIVDPRIRIR